MADVGGLASPVRRRLLSTASSMNASAMASLVTKYRLNVRGETSAIAAI